MKIRLRLFSLFIFALTALVVVTSCDRNDTTPFTAEIDEPGFRRGKELQRQGRNQEALAEFQKVIEKRGLNNAPESHLELGLLYQTHIHDPLMAIYHFRRYRELKPNSQLSDSVRQRIDAATREFARTLPGNPMESSAQNDMTDVVDQLKRENEQLKAQLAQMRGAVVPKRAGEGVSTPAEDESVTETTGPAHASDNSPVGLPSGPISSVETAPALPPPVRADATRPAQLPSVASTLATPQVQPPRQAAPTTAPGARKHVVAKGDTLMSLAQHYYGNRSRWRDIAAANRDALGGKTDLKIGMELKIPQ